MTYFYGQLFAVDDKIRAMFPPAMDVQRRRFFRALVRIAANQDDPAPGRHREIVLYFGARRHAYLGRAD